MYVTFSREDDLREHIPMPYDSFLNLILEEVHVWAGGSLGTGKILGTGAVLFLGTLCHVEN